LTPIIKYSSLVAATLFIFIVMMYGRGQELKQVPVYVARRKKKNVYPN
jgi:hypothetical protein